MSKNGNIKKAMATANDNQSLCTLAENIETMHVSARIEAVAMEQFDIDSHFEAVKKAGTAKNADAHAIATYEVLRATRANYRANLDAFKDYATANKSAGRMTTALCGKKNSDRAKLVTACYTAYVQSVSDFSATRGTFEQSLRNLLLFKAGLNLRTDAKTASDIATRLVYAFGMKVATKVDHATGANVGGITAMKEAEFKRVLVRALASLAMTGKVDIAAC